MSFGHFFGLLVKEKRRTAGLTQTDLAVEIYGDEANKSRVSEIESGKYANPHKATVQLFVVALGITDEEVMGCRKKGASKKGKTSQRAASKKTTTEPRKPAKADPIRVESPRASSELIVRIETLAEKILADRNNKDIWNSTREYYASLHCTLDLLRAHENGQAVGIEQLKDVDRTADLFRDGASILRELRYETSESERSLSIISEALIDLFGDGPEHQGNDINLDTNNSDARDDIEKAVRFVKEAEDEAFANLRTPLAGPLWGLIADINPGPGKMVGFGDIDARRKQIIQARGNDWIGGIAIELQAWLGQHSGRLPHKMVFRDKAEIWCPEMVVIDPPGKTFLMGAPEDEEGSRDEERPVHEVTIKRKFALGRYTVTFDEYDAYCEAVGIEKPNVPKNWGRGRRPVINVSWNDAQKYFAWLNAQLGLPEGTYRLPSEAEWEFACRAGTTTPFWTGATISMDQVNYDGDFPYKNSPKGDDRGQTVSVDEMPGAVNPWGFAHTHGNVWEWCADPWHDTYEGAPDDGSIWREDSAKRVLRGGSWIFIAHSCRSASRGRNVAVTRSTTSVFAPPEPLVLESLDSAHA